MNKKFIFGLMALLGCASTSLAATEFFVSPSGNDAAEGTKAAPFKTIEKAQKAVRAINGTMTDDITVYLREGTYALANTIKFTEADGGKNGHYVRYKAFGDERPLITGGMPITGWTLHDEKNNIWKAEGVDGRFRQLYVNNRKAVRACFPNVIAASDKGLGGFDHDFVRLTKVDSTGRAFDVSADYIKNIKNIEDVEIHLMIAWSENILRLEKAQVNGGTAKLVPKDPERTKLFHRAYPMLGTAFMSNPPKQQAFYLENSYDLIDAEGEWFLDEKTHTLYYKPRSGESMASANVVAPRINTLFSVLGKDTKTKVGYMAFEGLTFAHSNYTRPSEEGFLDLQAANFNVDVLPDPGRGNWEKLNSNKYLLWRPDAAFRVENAHHFLVQGCVFSQIAATGLDFVSGTNDDLIQGNAFFEVGAAGIMLGKFAPDSLSEIHEGYNPSDKDEISTRDTIKNNLVTNVTNEHQGAVGIGAGYPRYVVIEHNEVSYTYYSGISVGFGWTKKETAMTNNHINWNNIHHIARLLCDSGPIYTLSNQGTGSEIQHNYIHDNGTSKWADYWNVPIYLDEGSSGFTVKENVFKNSPAGVGQNQAGQNTLQQTNDYYSADVVNNAGIEKSFQYIREIKEIPMADFTGAMTQEPFKSVMTLPGKIELEDYDNGGSGVAYSDNDLENQGNVYREDGVDIVGLECADTLNTVDCKGYAIGYTNPSEWMEYSIKAESSAEYMFRARVASGLDVASFMLFVDGSAVTDTVKIPQGEDWVTYTEIDGKTAMIEKGEHILRVKITGTYGNLDWIQFALTEDDLAIKPAYHVNFFEGAQQYRVYNMNGALLGSVYADSHEVMAKTRQFVKQSGMYVVKAARGNQMFRVNVLK